MKKFKDVIKYESAAEKLYRKAEVDLEKLSPEEEAIVARSPEYACAYAKNVLKGRFPAGEKAIASKPEYAYFYAKNILKDRFSFGEKAIATDSNYAYLYAKDIIKGRFLEGKNQSLAWRLMHISMREMS